MNNAPAKRNGFPPPPAAEEVAPVKFGKVSTTGGHRIIVYGPGGIGKTTLATQAESPVAFFDLDDSLPRLMPSMAPEISEKILPVEGIGSWKTLRDALHAPGWDKVKTIVIDSLTKAEELCVQHTLETVPHEKGHKVARLEDYGYGKGYTHVFDTFLLLLGDLDAHTRAGRHILLICHDCTSTVPNPAGEDWLRYEPRLQAPASGKSSIRLRVREWADHVLFYGYDVNVKDGKGKGSGTRTLWPAELPHCMAKSRTLRYPVSAGNPAEIWGSVINGDQKGF